MTGSMRAVEDMEGGAVEVWVEGMLAENVTYAEGRKGPVARFTLRVPLHADGMLALRVEAHGQTVPYLKASESRRGDWLVVNGVFHDDNGDGYITAGTVCAHTSIGWHGADRR